MNQDEKFPVYTDDGKKNATETYFEERQYIGYRFFDTYHKKAAFDFGYGLSYAQFMKKSEGSFENGVLHIETEVTNISEIAGKESVLYYVESPS